MSNRMQGTDKNRYLVRSTPLNLLIGFLLLALTPTGVGAQVTAQINGSATDQTGAVLPGVEVIAIQTDTSVTRTTLTNETGSYTLPNLSLGPYRLEASLPGFRTYVQTGIVLQVGSNQVINAVLEVGQVAQTIEVEADALMVETRNTGIGQVIDNIRVLELPLNGRQATELILLSGAAIEGSARGTSRYYPTIAVSLGGGMDNGLTYRLDGGTHNDPFGNLNLPLPFPDALQEFKVETSAIPARHGQHSAGLVSMVTKSGTNEYHGSLFEFVRNKVFNARNAFAVERDGLKRNQFGGIVGGPIVSNKLFFFAGFQRTIQRSEPSARRAFIPTREMLAGDWTRVASAECRGRGLTLKGPFVDNQINPALFSPVALNIMKKIPETDDPCGEVRFGRSNNSDEDIYVGRVDYQKSDRHSLFARYTLHDLLTPSDYDGQNILSLRTANYARKYQSAVFGDTFLIGDNVVNSFRLTAFRSSNVKSLGDFFTLGEQGAKDVWYPEGFAKMMLVSISGGFNLFSAPGTPGFTNATGFEISDDVSWVQGDHQLAFGGSFLHQKLNVSAATTTPGSLRFRTLLTGMGLGDFMLGYVDRWRQGILATWYPRQDHVATFVQDTWRATSQITVNLGLRWEPYMPQRRKDNRQGRFTREWFDQGLRSTVFNNSPKGFLYSDGPNPPNIPGDSLMGDSSHVSKNLWMHFAPRVGVAWDPVGNGRMTIRAAYGIFYDYPHMYQFNGLRSLPPFENRITRTRLAGGLDDPWIGYEGGNPFPFSVTADAPFPRGATYVNVPEDMKSPYVNQWNLSVQRQMGPSWMVTANYLGTTTIHMLDFREQNPVTYIPGSSLRQSARRELALIDPVDGGRYGAINMADDGGTASYNALWLSVERRAEGLNFRLNYTWSHCIDDGSNVHSHSSGKMLISRRGANRGNCDLDRRHSFNTSTVYATPEFANPAARALLSGWRVSGIVKLISGPFMSVECGCDRADTDTDDQRANQLLPNTFTPGKSVDQYLNPAAFGRPDIGTYGNSGRNSIQAPGRVTIDIALARTFDIKESQSIEFRAEAFNLPNHLNPDPPIDSITNRNFGRILGADEERILQFALKYVF